MIILNEAQFIRLKSFSIKKNLITLFYLNW